MAMGRRKAKQKPLFVEAERMPSGPRHRFYDALNKLLDDAGFDEHVESLCTMSFEPRSHGGRPSIPPGVYFRMLVLGYFEGQSCSEMSVTEPVVKVTVEGGVLVEPFFRASLLPEIDDFFSELGCVVFHPVLPSVMRWPCDGGRVQ